MWYGVSIAHFSAKLTCWPVFSIVHFCKIILSTQPNRYKKKIKRCGIIASETTIHQSSNKIDINNYKQPCDLQQ